MAYSGPFWHQLVYLVFADDLALLSHTRSVQDETSTESLWSWRSLNQED